MTLQEFDEMFASGARPYSVYVCATAIAVCCIIPATAAEALPLATSIVGGVAFLRSRDKKVATDAATTSKQIDAVSGTTTPPVTPSPNPEGG